MAKRILLVDDERSIRDALSKVLRQEHYEVLVAECGQTAIDQYGAGHIDLMLLDLNLPGGNGWSTLRWLTKINPLLPVILITGRSYQRELAEKSGADALMEKPLDVPLLLKTIQDLLEESVETRTERATHRVPGLRVVPCDEVSFRQMLLDRFTVPYAVEPAKASSSGLPGFTGPAHHHN